MSAIFPWTQAAIAATGVGLAWKKPPALSTNRYPERFGCEQRDLSELLRVEVLQPRQCPELPPAVTGGSQPSAAGHSSHPLTRTQGGPDEFPLEVPRFSSLAAMQRCPARNQTPSSLSSKISLEKSHPLSPKRS